MTKVVHLPKQKVPLFWQKVHGESQITEMLRYFAKIFEIILQLLSDGIKCAKLYLLSIKARHHR